LLSDALKNDLSYGTCVLLCMGLDNGQGVMRLNKNGYLEIEWPQADNRPLYDAILAAAHDFGKRIGAKITVPMPNWWPPMHHNITVHALGGCIIGDAPQTGVVSAAPDTLGQVFGYAGLYVADGAIVPTAVGANPTATIAALSEMIAEKITGLAPTDQL
jgi:cholesterol oxidase